MQATLYNGLALAYIGDAVYELKIRRHVMEKGFTQVNGLHKEAVNYTKGEAQASIIRYLKDKNILNEEELSYYKRGRNSSVAKVRKNIHRIDYLEGTGFESLIGYLYLTNQNERLEYLMDIAVKYIDEGVEENGKEEESAK